MARIILAKSNNISGSPRKARLVIDMIRGKNALNAMEILSFTNKAVADDIYKTIASAVSNAVHNYNLDKKNLMVVQAFVNEAPTYKRGRAVARGRYHQIYKRNSHIVIGLQDLSQKPELSAGSKKKTTKATDKLAEKPVEPVKALKATEVKKKPSKKINLKSEK